MSLFEELKTDIGNIPEVQKAAPQQRAVLATARMIYNWRKAKGMSQLELATLVGMKQEAISRIERGTSKDGPKLSTLAAIAEACGQRLVLGGRPAVESAAADEYEEETAWTVLTDAPVPDADIGESWWKQIVRDEDHKGAVDQFATEEIEGNTAEPLICAYQYDERGSILFDAIVRDFGSAEIVKFGRKTAKPDTSSVAAALKGITSLGIRTGSYRRSDQYFACHIEASGLRKRGELPGRTYSPLTSEPLGMIVLASSKSTVSKVASVLARGIHGQVASTNEQRRKLGTETSSD